MKKVNDSEKQQLDKLNELVGKKKENVAKEKVAFKDRIKQSLLESADNIEQSVTTEEEQPKKPLIKKIPKNDPNAVRDRLRKRYSNQEKEKENEKEKLSKVKQEVKQEVKPDPENVSKNEERVKIESNRLKENAKTLEELRKKRDTLANKMQKFKDFAKTKEQ